MAKIATMTLALIFCFAAVSALQNAAGFAINKLARPRSRRAQRTPHSRLPCELSERRQGGIEAMHWDDDGQDLASKVNRRDAIGQAAYRTTAAIAASAMFANPNVSNADIEGVVTIPQSTSPPESKSSNVDGKSVTVFKTRSGLQYIELAEGLGPTPKYGNFVTIAYKAYIKLPDIQGKASKIDEFDSDRGYLVKHGNGRTVPGLDEGLHTMRVGGRRRIIVPPKLGYVTSGLGPIPEGPYGRWKLNRLIDRMIEVKGGNLIFDVEMKSILEDEADQGYYEDDSLSPEDFNTLRRNIEASQQAARAARES